MAERPRILVLDLLETFARERGMTVQIERQLGAMPEWNCVLTVTTPSHQIFRGSGRTAREAIMTALRGAGVKPED
jgi:hypothetical protein